MSENVFPHGWHVISFLSGLHSILILFEVTKVVEQVNMELVKEFNDCLVKVYHSEVNKIKLEVVMDDIGCGCG